MKKSHFDKGRGSSMKQRLYRQLLIMKAVLITICLSSLLLPELLGTIVGGMSALANHGDALTSGWVVMGEVLLMLFIGIAMTVEVVTLTEIRRTKLSVAKGKPGWHFWVKASIFLVVVLAAAAKVFMIFCKLNEFISSSLTMDYSINWKTYRPMLEVLIERAAVAFLFGGCCVSSMACDAVKDELKGDKEQDCGVAE